MAVKCNSYSLDMGRDPRELPQEAYKNGTFIFDMIDILIYESVEEES